MKKGKTISIQPKWTGLLPFMLQALQDENMPLDAKKPFTEEIMKLGEMADWLQRSAILRVFNQIIKVIDEDTVREGTSEQAEAWLLKYEDKVNEAIKELILKGDLA